MECKSAMHRLIRNALRLCVLVGIAIWLMRHSSLQLPLLLAQEGETIVTISSPRNGDRVSGVIAIQGTAIAPQFQAYRLDYAVDPPVDESSWVRIQALVTQQVRSSVLGAWDTTKVVDGRYIIRLQVLTADEEQTILEERLRVFVANSTPTFTPPPQPTVTLTPLAGVPTVGASPTSLIDQPPTRTPRPTDTPGGPTATPIPVEFAALNPLRIRRAVCNGGLITAAVFALFGLYLWGRAWIRDQWVVLVWRLRGGNRDR